MTLFSLIGEVGILPSGGVVGVEEDLEMKKALSG